VSWQAIRHDLEIELGEPITIDALTGAWQIAQRAGGHRHSADDVLTASFALDEAPAAPLALDLGTGIGGVGLLVLWGLGEAARLVAVEAQAISHRLLLANIAGNALTARVEAQLGDLRDFHDARRFPLVTGSPPYFPLGTGIVPADSQKAHARFELRGDVRDYALAAARQLAPGNDGVFVFCFPSPQKARALAAVEAAGLVTTRVRDVIPRATLKPLFTLFAARRAGSLVEDAPFVVREQTGELTAAMQQVRRRFGFH
jgi:tRNA1Val (adenine37-N6)-methyltransferase